MNKRNFKRLLNSIVPDLYDKWEADFMTSRRKDKRYFMSVKHYLKRMHPIHYVVGITLFLDSAKLRYWNEINQLYRFQLQTFKETTWLEDFINYIRNGE